VIIQLVAIPGAIWMSRLSSKFGNLKVLMGVVVFWILICLSAYGIASKAEVVRPYHEKITAVEKDMELLKKNKEANANQIKAAETSMAEIKDTMSPLQQPIEFGFYGLAIAVGLVMGGIQSLSRSTYSKLMPETKDTASFFSYYDVTEKVAIVIGIFSFGFIEEITGSMKNSVLSLILFFTAGLIWLYSALQKQLKNHH
jgi:MFS transporter, UMF1 family